MGEIAGYLRRIRYLINETARVLKGGADRPLSQVTPALPPARPG